MNTNAPRKPCRKNGCNILGTTAYCEKHTRANKITAKQKQKSYDKERGSRHERGYDSRWGRYSVAYRKANPLCVECKKKGIITLAQCVDHIVPVNGPDDPLFWEPSNHQGLCNDCHSIKTSTEDGGFGNIKKR